jgi:hypothetical protein
MNGSETEIAPPLAPTQVRPSDTPQALSMSADVLDMLMTRAKKWPRDLKLVQERTQQELEVVPELAARSYYSIPYNQGKQNETLVEGPSIKAAMTLARNWGNCFNQGRVQDEDKSNVLCQGVFIDLETGLLTLREIKVSKFYKPRGGQGVVPRNADMLYNSVQAGISKGVRNAVLASLPDFLVWSYFQRAKEIVVHPPASIGKPVASLQERIVRAKQFICKTYQVTPEEMENYLIENADMIEDDAALLVHLQGLYNSLKDGAYKVADVFRPGKAAADAPGMPKAQK